MKAKSSGTICVFLSAVSFSLAGILIKLISWSPITINGIRSIFGALVMLVFMKATKHKFKVNKVVILAAVCNAIMNFTYVMATKMTSAANAIVLQFTMPIFIIIFTAVFLGKRPKKVEVITCVVVFLGIICFFLDGLTSGGFLGNILAIISGATYAIVFMQKSIKNSDFESSVVISQFMSVVISIPFWFSETQFGFTNWWAVILLGTVQMGLSYVLLSAGLEKVTPITASIISTIEPILNPILVAVFCHETIGIYSFIGATIVICSVGVYNILGAKEKNKDERKEMSCS